MFLLISWCVARLDFQMAFAKTVFFAMVSLISHAPARLEVETAIFKTQDFFYGNLKKMTQTFSKPQISKMSWSIHSE